MVNINLTKGNVMDANIVVIGGGGAGLAAAVAAAEKGIKGILLIERMKNVGGNSAMAGGLFGIESPIQKDLNINVKAEELFKIHMNHSHWVLNPKVVRSFIDKSGDTIRWLADMGLIFKLLETDVRPYEQDERIFLGQKVPLTWHVPKGLGKEIVDTLLKKFQSLGGKVIYGLRAKEILMENGSIRGIIAEEKDKEINISAKVIIIATGGYGGNRELLKKWVPYYADSLHLIGFPNQGDGILMAMKVGAASEGIGILHLGPKHVPGEAHQIWVLSLQPNTIWINKRGERFADESVLFNHFELALAALRQPEGITYTFFDEKIKHKILETRVIRAGKLSRGKVLDEIELDDLIQSAANRGENVKISNSVDDIASWIGANQEIFKNTLNEYNSFCRNGYDKQYLKSPKYLQEISTPPYYAIKGVPRLYGTIGGIKVNEKMEVLNNKEGKIPGLFAAGIDTGGWESEIYDAFLLGHALGFAINSGRIAGENAAEYLLKK